MVTAQRVSRPTHSDQLWTAEHAAVIGGHESDAYWIPITRPARTPAAATAAPAPPSQANDADAQPAIPTPRMFNGYEHPSPYYEEWDAESFEERAEREARERYEALDCKCSVCVLHGPKYCPGDPDPLKPLTIEQARVARKLIVHDVKRIERAAVLVDDSAALEAATAKYETTAAGCQCPDKKHGPATRKCKHQLTAIISTNVQRQLAGDEAEEIEALPAGETTGDSPFTRMKARDARANAQAQLESASAAPVHTPERDDGMLWS